MVEEDIRGVTKITPWVSVAVSAIGSLSVGALVGAFVPDKLRERAERKREEREKRGLLGLVSIEIGYNEQQCKMLRAIKVEEASMRVNQMIEEYLAARTGLLTTTPSSVPPVQRHGGFRELRLFHLIGNRAASAGN